jgi:choline dehydrogenase-like flavoprotein
MDVLILGTGALATLFAARLSAAGASVTMLGRWREALDALDQRGARLADAEGRETAYPVRAVDSPEAYPPVRFALVLVISCLYADTVGDTYLFAQTAPDTSIVTTLKQTLHLMYRSVSR